MAGKKKGSVNIKIGGDASGYQSELNEAVKVTEEAAKKIDDALTDAAKSLSDGLVDAYKDAQKEQEKTVKNIGTGTSKIISYNSEVIGQKDKLGSVYDKLGDGAKTAAVKVKAGLADIKAGIDMAVSAADKLGDIVTKGINYNATIESMQTSFEVMTGSAEKAVEVVSLLRTLGAETPFEMTDLAGTTQLLMQYGFTADDAIEKMRMLGDIAQGNAQAMTSIATGYAQMASAGKVNLQDVKQMINAGFNPLQEISERTGESMASLYDRISKGTMGVEEITKSMQMATSEGGKFYQSMEKQSKTLNGQLSTLKDNADQLIGTLTVGMSQGLREEFLPLANNMIGELQNAFEIGGIQGLTDAATNMIPDLMDMMSGEFEKGIGAIGKWLPKGASALMKHIPQALSSGASVVIPQITTALFEVASVVVSDLTSMLPELIPVLFESVVSIFNSTLKGTIDVVYAFGDGITKALKKIGAIAPTASETLGSIIESVDEKTIETLKKTVDIDIDTDITVDDYQNKIDTAVSDVENALKNVQGLSEDEEEAIKNAIIDGSGIDVLQVAFDNVNIDSSSATTAITTAQDNVNGVIEGLGLSQTAKEHLQELIANNAEAAEIQSAIESYGVEAGVASTATQQITAEMDVLNAVLSELGVDKATVSQLRLGLFSDKKKVEAALKLLNMDEKSIETVLTSYDTIAGSLTAGIDGIYESIAKMFTDGKKESDQDVADAKAAIEGIAVEAKERVDKWYADKVAELNSSGLSGEVLDTELANTKAQYDSLTASINETTNTALAQTEDMVGKSTKYCKEQVVLLEDTFGLIKDITTEIDMLTDGDISEAVTSRKLTIEGVTNDTGTHLEAFLLTYKEYTDKVRTAEEEYLSEIEQARAAVEKGGSKEEYATAEAAAKEKLSEAKQYAADYYQQYVDAILGGIMAADPAMGAIFQQAIDSTALSKMAFELDNELISAFNSNRRGESLLTLEDILGKLQISDEDINNLATAMGISPKDLMEQMNDAIVMGGTDFGQTSADFNGKVEDGLKTMLSGNSINLSGIAGTLATAIESGYLIPEINGIDYSNASALWEAALSAALESDAAEIASETAGSLEDYAGGKTAGEETIAGYEDALTQGEDIAYERGKAVAAAFISGYKTVAEIASPSKAMRRMGKYTGEGLEIGLRESMERAVSTAKRLTGQIVTAADISRDVRVNVPGLQQEIVGANQQTTTPVYLDGVQIAEIQGHNNSTQLAWQNTRAAKGVGSR